MVADPAQANVSQSIGDLGAIMMRFAALVRPSLADNAAREALDALGASMRTAIVASDASTRREKNTRELKSVTRIPEADYGVQTNVANIRLQAVNIFKGDSGDPQDVLRWLSRTLNLAQVHGLTLQSARSLFLHASAGGASDYIEQLIADGKTLREVIPLLEMRYAALCPPEEARERCNTMPRKDKELFSDFMDRLRSCARMSCRDEENEDQKRKLIDILVESNIRRILPRSVKLALEERIIARRRSGHPEFTSRELEAECIELERKRNEREQQRQGVTAQTNKRFVRKINVDAEDESGDSSDSDSTSDDEGDDEGHMHQLIQAIRHEERRFVKRGRDPNQPAKFPRAFRKYEGRNPPPKVGKQYARQAFGKPGLNRGPPEVFPQGSKQKIYELLHLACVPKGSCIQCGIPGHMLKSPDCPLRDQNLVDRACAKCGQGLHQADVCTKVFQTPEGAHQVQEPASEVKND